MAINPRRAPISGHPGQYFPDSDYIRPSDSLPDIDLIHGSGDDLSWTSRHGFYQSRRSESDKILTKTMINNYAKNDLLPPPGEEEVFQRAYAPPDFYLLF